ncbi:MAG: aspartate aminotransferase family protein [Candidatus Margulisiibacteriota bacterium]
MTAVLHRHTKANLPTAVGGEGCYIFDSAGKRYFDGSGGAAVSCLGHNHPEVVAAIQEQAGKLAYAHSSFFTTEPMEKLASFLIDKAPAGLSHVYFVSGGSEAVEAALKLARQFWVETGKPSKYRVIARKQSYHGNTLGALAVGGNLWRRKLFEPLLMEASHLSPCYEYRGKQAGETTEAYGQRVASELEAEILRLGPDTVSAFICEPVVGATMGCVPAVPGYLKRIREICDRYEVLLILDEVMCGMGRTGTLFACEQDGVTADLIAVAKGLGAGYQPIGALLLSAKIFSTIQNGTGFFQHGHTYLGHTLACAASLKVQEIIQRDNLLAAVNRQGRALKSALEAKFKNHPHVGDIRGRGLFIGLELVENRDTKTPFDPTRGINATLKKQAMAEGLLCYPMGGTLDGQHGDHVMLAPPFIMEDAHIGEIVSKLSKAINTVCR